MSKTKKALLTSAADTPQAPPGVVIDPDTLPLVMTTPEVATLARLDVQTLEGWRVRGEGPVYTRLGRSVRYHRADVLNWLDQQRVIARYPAEVLS